MNRLELTDMTFGYKYGSIIIEPSDLSKNKHGITMYIYNNNDEDAIDGGLDFTEGQAVTLRDYLLKKYPI